jgi:uncharacterized membrane protein YgdD (TMEM256/DUF423 family)
MTEEPAPEHGISPKNDHMGCAATGVGRAVRWLRVFASVAGLVGVGMGAFGAHLLRGSRSPELLAAFQTGVLDLFLHTLAILAIVEVWRQQPETALPGWSAGSMALGTVLFSGSLFALALSEQRWLGAITPLGGVSFLVGWLLLTVHFVHRPPSSR